MIIIDPVSLGDVAFSRASPKWASDKVGALVQVPANALAVTYDPSDLGRAPYALVEPEAINQIRNNTMQGAAPGSPGTLPATWQWGTNVGLSYEVVRTGIENGVDYIDVRIYGTATGAGFAGIYFEGSTAIAAAIGQVWANSVYCRAAGGSLSNISSVALCIDENNTVPSYVTGASAALKLDGPLFPQSRGTYVHTVAGVATAYILPHIKLFNRAAGAVDLTLRIGLPQTERDRVTSSIKTALIFTGRATEASYWNGSGVLTSATAGVERVSYNPSNLGAAPMKLWEPAATNFVRNNTMQGASVGTPGVLPMHWADAIVGGLTRQVVGTGVEDGINYLDVRIFGTLNSSANSEYTLLFETTVSALPGEKWQSSFFMRIVAGTLNGVWSAEHFVLEYNSSGGLSSARSKYFTPPTSGALRENRNPFEHIVAAATTVNITNRVDLNLEGAGSLIDVTMRVGLPQLERSTLTSPIKSTGSVAMRAADVLASGPITRAADVIGAGAGLVYSSVPITEPNYDSAATYGKDATVHDPATHNTFQSLIAANKGKALTDTTAWTPRGATNRWAMLDQYNNTQTTAQDEILLVVSPKAISRGFYIGNTDAVEVRISVVDLYKGLVYQEVQSLKMSTSKSSVYNWCFNRIRRRSWAVSLKLPPYYSALATISIRKPGGTAACGMCAIGPTMDLGKTLMGLGAEIKDFSETSFKFDGTSTTKKRNWAKRISADIVVDSNQVEAVYEELARLRQKPLVWVGSPKFGLSIAFGRYSGIKPVIKGATRWDISAQIEGTV